MKHHWDAPTPPPGAPSGASVVARSRCGRKVTVPAWQLAEWKTKASQPSDDDCPPCLESTRSQP